MFRRKNGRRVLFFRGAFDIGARKTGIAEVDAQYGEPFMPQCYRRSAISRWTKLMPEAIVRRCSGHADRDVHENYITFEDRELVEAFAKAGLLSPPVQKCASVGEKEVIIANVG